MVGELSFPRFIIKKMWKYVAEPLYGEWKADPKCDGILKKIRQACHHGAPKIIEGMDDGPAIASKK